jgi:hypothetical protein
MFGLTKEELETLKPLNTPSKIQTFLNKIPINFEEDGETCGSPRRVLREWKAHCAEGAILAAAIMKLQGEKPLLIDLTANKKDFDHLVCVFKRHGCWGGISKTNHGVLRYREPIYKNIRELVMSYFHEYFDDFGKKNLRSYSLPVNLNRFKFNWIISEEDLWEIPGHMANVKHFPILTRGQIAGLRIADKIELEMGDLLDWKDPKKKQNPTNN